MALQEPSGDPEEAPCAHLAIAQGQGQQQPQLLPATQASGSTDLGPEEIAWLESCAIVPEQRAGITRIRHVDNLPQEFRSWGKKVVPAYCFTWRSASGREVLQLRPDLPPMGRDGRESKYIFPKGSGAMVGIARGFEGLQSDSRVPALIIEGTKQLLAAASILPLANPIAVPFGVGGCWGWSGEGKPGDDLNHMALEGRDVLVAFDADLATNHNVYEAAKRLKDYLLGEFLARSVKFLQIPGGEKDGLDDLLSRVDTKRRFAVLQKLITDAVTLPTRAPRKPAKAGSQFFDDGGNLKTETLWKFLDQEQDLALAGDDSIAVYHRGVYWNGKSKHFTKLVAETLGDYFKPEHLRNVEEFGIAHLKVAGRVIPFKQSQPWLNFQNGILNLEANQLLEHNPGFLTLVQWPFNWDSVATCPTFDAWLEAQLPGQGEVLLDACSQMLDQTRQPTRMVFLWGPSRTGKSTLLRILRALAGKQLCSSVSLHKLSDRNSGAGRFSPARLFGKVLNTFADLSSDDLSDLSVFKSLTGEDTIDAEYKGKDGFDLENMAMLAYSANAVPSVSEGSQAYFTRTAAFHFARTFLGAEDPRIEQEIMAELPGIMKRLVEALTARRQRGRFLNGDAETAAAFARHSDRVRLFLYQTTRQGDRSQKCIFRSDLYQKFKIWAEEEQGGKGRILGKQKFNDRVRNAGVEEFKPADGVMRWNLLLADPETTDPWGRKLLPPDPETAVGGGAKLPCPTLQRHQPSWGQVTDPAHSSFDVSQGFETAVGEKADASVDLSRPVEAPRQFRQFPPIPPLCISPETLVLARTECVETAGTAVRFPGSGPVETLLGARLARIAPAAGLEPQPDTADPAVADQPHQQTTAFALTPPPGKPKRTRKASAAKPAPVDLLSESDLGPLPTDLLSKRGDTAPLVVDLETCSADRLWETPMGPSGGFIRLIGTDHGVSTSAASLLDHAGPLVAHNGFGFDFLALAHHHGLDLLALSEDGRLVDTMALALVLDPPEGPASGKLSGGQVRRLFSLNNCTARAGLPGKTDDLGKLATAYAKAAGIEGTPSQLAAAGYGLIPRNHPDYIAYLRGDITANRALFDYFCPSGTLTPYAQREMRVLGRLVAGITLAGSRLDVPLTQARYDEVEARKEACRQVLIDRYGLPTHTGGGALAANPLNCKGAAEAITEAAADVGLELPTTAKSGKPSTSRETLGPLREEAIAAGRQEQVDLLETILGLTGARSVYGTALDHLQHDGRVHPQVAALQASGRFSITSPGVTVYGKRGGRVIERAIFLPDSTDHVLVATDLAQIDMRAMAAHAQDPAYLDLFAPGRDVHTEIAAVVGLTREEAKQIGHGWNYGMSVNGMVKHGVERAKAEKFDQGMCRRFPVLVAWRDRIREKATAGERLDNGFGRMMRPNPERAWTQAPALMGQGTSRDLMMEAVLRLPLELVPMLRFLVHDELVFSIPLADADRLEVLILEAMNFEWAPPSARHSVKVSGDLAKRGMNWADCYRKD